MSALTFERLQSLVPEMVQWVNAGYPNEACGMILEKGGSLSVLCCENLQDRLHRLDPGRYPRTAATAYSLDPLLLYRATQSGAEVRAIFHSHPDRSAYLSDEDVLGALGGDSTGEPLLPGTDYIVLSARPHGVDDVKLFSWDPAVRQFVGRC